MSEHGRGHAARWLVIPDMDDRRFRARMRVALLKHGVSYRDDIDKVFVADGYGAMGAGSLQRRLEVWVNCTPPELVYSHPHFLRGQMLDVGNNRAVLLTEMDWSGRDVESWDEDLWKVKLFDEIDVHDWNLIRCPRCGETDNVRESAEGIWWCPRHMTRVWEPIEYREGVSWQENRMLDVG